MLMMLCSILISNLLPRDELIGTLQVLSFWVLGPPEGTCTGLKTRHAGRFYDLQYILFFLFSCRSPRSLIIT